MEKFNEKRVLYECGCEDLTKPAPQICPDHMAVRRVSVHEREVAPSGQSEATSARICNHPDCDNTWPCDVHKDMNAGAKTTVPSRASASVEEQHRKLAHEILYGAGYAAHVDVRESHAISLLADFARQVQLEEHKLDCPRCIPKLRCIGYPGCDGDLPGEEHSEECLARGLITLPCERIASLAQPGEEHSEKCLARWTWPSQPQRRRGR